MSHKQNKHHTYTYHVYYNAHTGEITDFTNWSKRAIRKVLAHRDLPTHWREITSEFRAMYDSCEVTAE